jgi:glutamyl-tRNA synthetase
MDWGNAYIRDIETKSDGTILSIRAQLHLEGDFKKTDKKITWIANVEDSLTPCILTTYDHLITKDKLEEDDKVENFVNPHTVESITAHGDINLRTLAVGSIIQFERKGYYRLDRAYDDHSGEAGEFILVPDGKTVNRYGAKESGKA